MMQDMKRPEKSAASIITVRNLPPEVARIVRDKARRENLSLNKAVARMLEEIASPVKGKRVLHHELDRFFGTWTRKEADAFDRALQQQRQIDPEMWK